MASSMNRLSSGFRINSARDDSAGMAIANKLSFQLAGLQRATENSGHGISLVQTAEGALDQVHAMLQRIRELGVKAANDTNVEEDRMAIQLEINDLTDEISALSGRAEFNTIRLLSGEGGRVATSWATLDGGDPVLTRVLANPIFISESVPPGTFNFNIVAPGQPAIRSADLANFELDDTILSPVAGQISLNGVFISVYEGQHIHDIWRLINEASVYAGVEPRLVEGDEGLVPQITSTRHGSHEMVDLGGDPQIWALLGLDMGRSYGTDVQIADFEFTHLNGNPVPELSPPNAIIQSIGNRVTVVGSNNHTIELSIHVPTTYRGIPLRETAGVPPEYVIDPNTGWPVVGDPIEMELRIEPFGGLRIQIGPNYNMNMNIIIPRVNAETLGLMEYRAGSPTRLVHVTTNAGAQRAIDQANDAIRRVSRIRSRLGAYQNRLEHTIDNLTNAAMNTEGARSRIRDTDMAREMTLYSKRQVMYQAGLSILAQANARPQMILQLLQ